MPKHRCQPGPQPAGTERAPCRESQSPGSSFGFSHLSNEGKDACPASPTQGQLCTCHTYPVPPSTQLSVPTTSARRSHECLPYLHTAQPGSLHQKGRPGHRPHTQRCVQTDVQTLRHMHIARVLADGHLCIQQGTHHHLHTQVCTTY